MQTCVISCDSPGIVGLSSVTLL